MLKTHLDSVFLQFFQQVLQLKGWRTFDRFAFTCIFYLESLLYFRANRNCLCGMSVSTVLFQIYSTRIHPKRSHYDVLSLSSLLSVCWLIKAVECFLHVCFGNSLTVERILTSSFLYARIQQSEYYLTLIQFNWFVLTCSTYSTSVINSACFA